MKPSSRKNRPGSCDEHEGIHRILVKINRAKEMMTAYKSKLKYVCVWKVLFNTQPALI